MLACIPNMQLVWNRRPLFLLRIFKNVLKPFCCWFWTFWLSRRGGDFYFIWLRWPVMYSIEDSTCQSFHKVQSSMMMLNSLKYLCIKCSCQDSVEFLASWVEFLASWWLGHRTFCILVKCLKVLQTVSETPCLTSQVRTTSQTAEQERSLNDQSLQLLRDDLARVKQSLSDCQRREGSVCLLITYCMKPSGCKVHFSTLGFMFSFLMHCLYKTLSVKWWRLFLAIHGSSSHLINGFWLNFISLYSGII